MKIPGVRFLVVFVLLAGASFAVANPFKSKIITSSALQISVPSDHSLKITNFSQEGGTDRGVVAVTFNGEGNSGTANVLTAIRIDFSTGGNAQNFPEIANKVIIAGPAEVTVAPVTGAEKSPTKALVGMVEVEAEAVAVAQPQPSFHFLALRRPLDGKAAPVTRSDLGRPAA